MSGYYRDGHWLSTVVGGYREGTASAEQAALTATRRVEKGETTALHELRELLARYPCLKLDRENHPLKTLAELCAKEVLGT